MTINSLINDIQNIAADKTSYRLDGSATNYIATQASSILSLGLSDATILVTASTKSKGTNQLQWLGYILGTGSFSLSKLDDTGVLRVGLGSNYYNTSFSIIENQVFTFAVTRYTSSTKIQAYLNGVAEAERAVTASNISTNAQFFNGDNSVSSLKGNIYRSLIFNYALSADKIARYSAGAKLDYEDVGGSMNPKYGPQAFTSTLDSFNPTGSGVSLANTGSVVLDITGLNATDYLKACYRSSTLTVGKRYRVTAKLSCASGTKAIKFGGGNDTYASMHSLSITTTPTVYTYDFDVPCTSTEFDIWSADTNNVVITIDDLSLIQLGAVLDLEPENITDGTWFDVSPNGLHGTVTGALAQRFTPQYDSRNYIINGAFDFWQRGTASSGFSEQYVADRFKLGTTVTGSVSQITGDHPTDTSKYSLQLAKTTTSSPSQINHYIESATARSLKGKVVTLSFWAKRTVGSLNIFARISSLDTEDNTSATTQIIETEVVLSSSWQRYSVTTKLTDAVTKGIRILLYTPSTTDGTTVRFADIMLNEGPVAAPFQRAGGSIGGEEMLCKRYCQQIFNSSSSGELKVRMSQRSSNDLYFTMMLPVAMRVNPYTTLPTMVENTDWGVQDITTGGTTGFTLTALNASRNSILFRANKTAHGITDACLAFLTSKAYLDAEL